MEPLKSTLSCSDYNKFRRESDITSFYPDAQIWSSVKGQLESARKQVHQKKSLHIIKRGTVEKSATTALDSYKNNSQLGLWYHSGGNCVPLLYPLGN